MVRISVRIRASSGLGLFLRMVDYIGQDVCHTAIMN